MYLYSLASSCVCRAAAVFCALRKLHLSNGMLLAVPIPARHVAAGAVVESATNQALEEADTQGIKGSDVSTLVLLHFSVVLFAVSRVSWHKGCCLLEL